MNSYNNGQGTDRAGGFTDSFNPAASIEASLNFSTGHNAQILETLNWVSKPTPQFGWWLISRR